MLGRYVAGTLLVLGVAMLVAPEAAEPPATEVGRAQTAPLSVAASEDTPEPVPVASAAAASEVRAVPLSLAAPRPQQPSAPPDLIDAAVMEALDAAPSDGDVVMPGIAALAGLEQAQEGNVTLAAAPASDGDGALMFVSGNRVNVRSGPSTAFGVITSVGYGEAVELMGEEGDGWARIRIEGSDEIGYMALRFLTADLNGG